MSETLEQKVERLEQEVADLTLGLAAYKNQAGRFSTVAGVIDKAIAGFSERNIQRNVKAFIEAAKAGNTGVT